MTYDEIIQEADERYPNALSADSKRRKIFNREKELFRTLYRKKTATVFDILAGQMLYPLPFHHSKILYAIVEGRQYPYEEINNMEGCPPFLYTFERSLGLYPTPEKDVSEGIFVFHWAEPTGTDTSFDTDWSMILVYGLCADMAEIARDSDMVAAFAMRYNELIDDYKRTLPEPEIPDIEVV